MSDSEVIEAAMKWGEAVAPAFARGDVVMLKSGGPAMTVVGLTKGMVECEWFDASAAPGARSYPATALVPWKMQWRNLDQFGRPLGS